MDRITSKARLILSLDDSSFALLIDRGWVGPRSSGYPLWPNFPTEQTVASGQHVFQIWPLPPEARSPQDTQQQATQTDQTVTATDYEFQRAVLCCLAAGWSQSPSTLMQSPGMGSTAMCQCAGRLMQSPACIKHLCMRLLNVRHHLGQCP
jgi:hypothetical protein